MPPATQRTHCFRHALASVLLCFTGLAVAQTAPPPGETKAVRFDILEFVVVGNTVLAPLAIEKAVYPFLGPGRTLADAEAARKALEKTYQDAGYLSVTVDIPPQRVGDAGELRLQVIEATVDKLRITGARYHLPSAIAAQVPSLAEGSVPNFNDMQDELTQVQRQSPHREVTPLIAASETPGAMNVELKVQDKLPISSFVELNSKQSLNTERGRLEANLSYDNLFQRQHSFGAYWFYSPRRPEEANILSLTYRLPLGGPGDQLYVVLNRSDSNTPTALGGATVTRGSTLGLRWRDALSGLPNLDHALTWGVSYRDLRDRNDDVAGASVESAPLRYPVFSLQYELSRAGDAGARLSTVEAGVNVGLAALGRRDVDCNGRTVDQFECRRAGAKPGFAVLTALASHREPFGKGWSVYGRLQGQLSLEPLVPAEQITQGGVDSVRGYFEGEQSGESALALRLETATPRFGGAAGLRGLLFWDRAVLSRRDPLPGELSRVQMGSVGVGLRVETDFGLQARLDWARVLFDTRRLDAGGAQLPLSGGAAGRERRWELSVRQAF
jgi:hemolysin activation/secretion protein